MEEEYYNPNGLNVSEMVNNKNPLNITLITDLQFVNRVTLTGKDAFKESRKSIDRAINLINEI